MSEFETIRESLFKMIALLPINSRDFLNHHLDYLQPASRNGPPLFLSLLINVIREDKALNEGNQLGRVVSVT